VRGRSSGITNPSALRCVHRGSFAGAEWTVYAQNHPFGAREFTIDGRLVRAISADPTGEAKITPIEGGGLNVPYHAEWINLRTVHHDISPMPDNTVIFLSSALHEITPEQRAAVGCPPDDTFEWNPFLRRDRAHGR
jgi:hypothetical protein